MPASPLLPPAGAEPGSVWLLVCAGGAEYVAATWDSAGAESLWLFHDRAALRPEQAASRGYHLADPHGAAAAVAVLEGWRAAGPDRFYTRTRHVDGWHNVSLYEMVGTAHSSSTHETSELAAALAAVREWEGRDG